MRFKREADGDSDHFLVLIKIRLRISNHWKPKTTTSSVRFNNDKLRDENVLQQFQLEIKDVLNHHFTKQGEPVVQSTWNIFKNSVLRVSDSIITQPPKSKAKHHFNQKRKPLNYAIMLDY